MFERGISKTIGGLLAAIGLLAVLSLISIPVSRWELEAGTLVGEAGDSFVRLFSLDAEGNIPTWFSSAMLLAASALLGVIAHFRRRHGQPFANHWAVLALVFLYISMDETARIHEMLGTPVNAVWDTNGFLHFGWIIPGILFVVLFAAAYVPFLFHLPRRTRRGFLIAGTVFVVGAIGFESLCGYFYSRSGSYLDVPFLLAANVEEVLEMVGIVILLHALLLFIQQELRGPILEDVSLLLGS